MRWWRRKEREQELERELRTHLELEAAEQQEIGVSEEEAPDAARRAFGNMTLVKEVTREMWGWTILERFFQDLRYAGRTLRKSPGFSATAVLSLALGIGANTAIFTLIDTVLFKMLPVRDPQQLVFFGTGGQSGTDHNFYFETYQRLEREQRLFTELAAFSPVRLNVSVDGQSEPSVEGQLVSGTYFPLLGIGAVIGRTLTPDDDRIPGAHPVAVISHDYWQRRFEGSREVIGRKILIDGSPFTIVGVAPPGFAGLEVGTSPKLLVPIMMQPAVMPGAENWLTRPRNTVDWLRIVGRLNPGVTLQQAVSGMTVIYHRIQMQLAAEIDPQWETTWLKQWVQARLVLEPGSTGISDLRRQFSAPLAILMAVVGLVLLIACANIANLLLARASARQREMAVRVAVGASRGRLIRQTLVESLLLSCLGGGLGLLSAYWASGGLVRFLSTGRTPISLDLTPDIRVLSFTGFMTIATGILFGLVPALRSSRVDLTPALKEGGYAASPHQGFGRMLIVSQFALSLVLITGAGLFATSFRKLNSVDAGFKRDQVLTVRLEPKGSDQKGANAVRLQQLYLKLQEEVQAIPGVVAAGFAGVSPTASLQARTVRTPEGRQFRISWTQVYPKYFETLGAPILQGRDFSAFDIAPGAPYVAIINETFAHRGFGAENPIGKRIVCNRDQACEVIGVVRDIKYSNLKGDVGGVMYMTFLQAATGRGQMVLHVRCAGDSEAVIAQVRRRVSGIDPNLPAFEIRTLETEVDAVLVRERLLALLSTFFGALAVLLAAVGLYGIVAYTVGRLTKELGVRMALGASRRKVQWLVLGETIRLAGVGILLGVPPALGASRFIETFLYGSRSAEPAVLFTSVGLLVAIALLAGFVPSCRASRVDPMVALRYE